jgi:hypothetical protein
VDVTSLPSITDATEWDMAADRQNALQVQPTTDIKTTPDGAPEGWALFPEMNEEAATPPPQRPLPPQPTDLPTLQPQEPTFNTYYNPFAD